MRRRTKPVRQLFQRIATDVKLGKGVRLYGFTNLYGCEIGDEVKIGAFVEVQKGAKIGSRCKISSHSFICEGVTLEEEVEYLQRYLGRAQRTFYGARLPPERAYFLSPAADAGMKALVGSRMTYEVAGTQYVLICAGGTRQAPGYPGGLCGGHLPGPGEGRNTDG